MSTPAKNPKIARGIGVNLTHQASKALDTAMEIERLSLTDTVNRALSVYAYIAEQRDKGAEILIKDKKGQITLLHIT